MRGLTMSGGTVKGVTEISSNLTIPNSGSNVAGQILALIPLHPQLIAPGTRLSDVAAMYDQYVFSSIKFELDPSLPYACGGRLLGFVERDATDPIGSVGTAVGNVQEWMDHGSCVDRPVQGGAGQARLEFPRQGKYMYRIGKGPVGGYYLNKLAVSGSTTSTDINNCYQGQFVLMLHTPVNTEGGQALSYPVPLGPLRVHWTLKFREAAERSQGQSGVDKHLITNGSGATINPLNWTSTLTKQLSLQSWSTLGAQTRLITSGTVRGFTLSSTNALTASLNVGFYEAHLIVDYSTSGAADWAYHSAADGSAYGSTQTGVTWIDWGTQLAKLSSSNVEQGAFLQFEVLTPGELVLFASGGTSTSWIIDNYASLFIYSIPASAITLLKHPNLQMRSLAFQKHAAKAGTGQALAAQIRQELGLPPKEEKDDSLEQAWQRILQDEAKQDLRNSRAHKPVDKWDSKEDDDWDEMEYQHAPPTMRRAWHEPESPTPSVKSEREERKKPASQSRVSSLKSQS